MEELFQEAGTAWRFVGGAKAQDGKISFFRRGHDITVLSGRCLWNIFNIQFGTAVQRQHPVIFQ
jgi:hypothetical protein